jgi:hypothetical protein
MAGIKIVTKTNAHLCLRLAWRAAQDLGFSITPIDDTSKRFTATKGNAVLGVLAGPIAPHCHFEIAAESYPAGNELSIDINKPWLTSGSIGVRKVREQADALINAIVGAIAREGEPILQRKEY